MKAAENAVSLALLGAGLILGLALSLELAVPSNSARANPGVIVGLDMDPAGNFCSGPAVDCTLGPIDDCISVPNTPGLEFSIDLFITGLTNGLAGWNENVNFPDSQVIVQAEDSASGGVVILAQSTGSVVTNLSEDVPDPAPPFHAAAVDLSTSETTPPFTKGVLDRLTLRVAPGATTGVYGLTLDGPPLAAYPDQDAHLYAVDQKWDASFTPSYGIIALGVPCGPLPTPTPPAVVGGSVDLERAAPAASADGSDAPAIPYAALAGLAVAAFVLTAGAWCARRWWAR